MGVVDRNFWKDKRVFITGHTGFKGSWLALWLSQLGASVTGFSNCVPTEPSFWRVASVGESVKSIEGDVRDVAALVQALQDARPDILFHLAAQSLVRRSYEDPIGTFSTNIMGTVTLFEAVRKISGVRALVNVTSDKCYENRELRYAYRESDPMGGKDPYSCSKGCAELLTSSYRQSFFSDSATAIASVRAGNVIGGGDWAPDRLIPDCVRAFARKEVVLVRNPTSIRPWQHVLDALRGYLLLGQNLFNEPSRFSFGFNFGPPHDDIQSVSRVVEQVCKHWGADAAARLENGTSGNSPDEAHTLLLDSSLAHKTLGWRPLLKLDQALQWSVDWYRSYYRGEDVKSLSLEQLASIELLEREIQ